jgi:nitrate reductase gamma subunit
VSLVALWCYLTLAAFAAGCVFKALRYATAPMHLRWELYPLPISGRSSFGGSYFEEVDWWVRPPRRSRLAEVRVIAAEVLTLATVRRHNRPLWLPSLAFHWGLYLLFALGAVLLAAGPARAAGAAVPAALGGGALLSAWSATGLTLGTLGALALLARRTLQPRLRGASTPADFLHLGLLLTVFAASWGSWLVVDRGHTAGAAFAAAIGSFRHAPVLTGWTAAQVVLLGLFLAYLPWSHMAHFFTKFFTWHSVRWDDLPAGERHEAALRRALMLPTGWSAPHVRGDGRRTWDDVVRGGGGRST